MDHDYTLDELFGIARNSINTSPHCKEYDSKWCISHKCCSECREHLIKAIERKVADEYVELPKDADGLPWHRGHQFKNLDGEVRTVWIAGDNTLVSDGHLFYFPANTYRHHRPPTVEDVLDEIVDKANHVGCAYASNDMSGDEMMDALKAIITEFAPRLRLADKED